MSSLEGKVALITGSGRNLGKATAVELARLGADVVVNARTNHSEIDDVAAQCRTYGVRALPIIADVASGPAVEAMVQRATKELGHVDIVVNMVGIRPFNNFLDSLRTNGTLSSTSISQAASGQANACCPR